MKKIFIISGFGFNSEFEVLYILNALGGDASILHLSSILEDPKILDNSGAIIFPGGFSFADNLGAGFAASAILKAGLGQYILELAERGIIFLGICNGCQILVKLGLFSVKKPDCVNSVEKTLDPTLTLVDNCNDLGYFCGVKTCEVVKKTLFWFKGLDSIDLPVAHGEGRFIIENSLLNQQESLMINKNCFIALKYMSGENHNGSEHDIAGVVNASGNVLALMPHPERGFYLYSPKGKENIEKCKTFFKNLLANL